MKTLEEIKAIINQHKQELEEKYKVKKIALFGSYARGDQHEKSDLDVLVEFREPVGALFFHLADFLEEQLGLEVDLVTRDGIKSPIDRNTLKRSLLMFKLDLKFQDM